MGSGVETMATVEEAILKFVQQCVGTPAEKSKKKNALKKMFNFVCGLELEIEKASITPSLIAKINNKVDGASKNKAILAERVRDFLEYVNRQYRLCIPVEELKRYPFSNEHERMIEMLKFLQEGKKTREDIAEHLCQSTKTISADLKKLQDGYSLLGHHVQIEIKRSENTYESTIHPVILPLNLSEVYALTVGLKMLKDNKLFGTTYDYLADYIYDQLSEYGKKRISKKALEEKVEFREGRDRKYRFESDLLKEGRELMFLYPLKSEPRRKIEFASEDGVQTIIGNVTYAFEGQKIDHSKIMIKSNDGMEVIVECDRVISISEP